MLENILSMSSEIVDENTGLTRGIISAYDQGASFTDGNGNLLSLNGVIKVRFGSLALGLEILP